jgi:Rrf2 family protein
MAATSRFAVAVHALTALAYRSARGEAWTTSETLAESVRTNPVVVRRALAALARAGLVESQTGRGGGTRLARAPEQISLAAVYHAVEDGERVFAHNPNPPNASCAVSRTMHCALTPVFAAVDAAIDRALGERTLADVVAQVPDPGSKPAPASAPAPA